MHACYDNTRLILQFMRIKPRIIERNVPLLLLLLYDEFLTQADLVFLSMHVEIKNTVT
jgi:hypothetical protein